MASQDVSPSPVQDPGGPRPSPDDAPASVHALLAQAWPLLGGIALLMLGLGLVQTLLGVRATIEGFSTVVTGLLMSAYYGGFLLGSLWAPRVVRNVGHIRAFAALASIASVAFLLHGVFHDPLSWAVMRIVGGLCIAGSMVVAESWLNASSTNETRGGLLGIYMVVTFGGLAAGQLLLNLDDPARIGLFVLASVLVSLAVVPVSISRHQAPSVAEAVPMSLREVAASAPLAILTAAVSGIGHGALITIGAVYAVARGLPLSRVSLFMGAIILGAVVVQIPAGRLSDRFGRRLLIALTALSAGGAAGAALLLAPPGRPVRLIILMAVVGAFTFPLYPLAVTHLNDRLQPAERVAAGSKLVLVNGIGAAIGPISATTAMALFGNPAFLWHQVAVHGVIALYALYRLGRWAPVEVKSLYAPFPSGATPVLISLSPERTADTEHPERPSLVHLPGTRIHVRERGAGEAVVLIHDVASSSRTWQHQLRALPRSGYRVIAYDLRGHGSSDPGRTYQLPDHVEDLRDLLDELGVDRAHLVGLGVGASVALAFGDVQPDRVRSLVCVSCARWILPAALRTRLGERIGSAAEPLLVGTGTRHGLARRWARSVYDPRHHPDRYELIADDAARAHRRAIVATLNGGVLERRRGREVPVPTLVLLGERDRATTAAAARRLRRLLPSARIALLPNAAHFAPLDDPHGFDALVRSFLDAHRAHGEPTPPR